ncbi:hypothetical protein BLA6863_01326 [Burkholderia lata]|uniref:Uncharacterized protein n=1 Tax=Burkholderia lata (strain ATCC 17760 / DSM 23089 / LMG 22485 / NCIMB 9086 / R18194 / 383) TaxID=482957 RepID=A0A6P2IQ89_BURL3|nr:hypothetical protein BLA6863_01326 [Burkholderia lata]
MGTAPAKKGRHRAVHRGLRLASGPAATRKRRRADSHGWRGNRLRRRPSDRRHTRRSAAPARCVDRRRTDLEPRVDRAQRGALAQGYVANNPVNRTDPTGSNGVTTDTGIQIVCNGWACVGDAWSVVNSHARGPDSVIATIPLAPGFGFTMTMDRYGLIYVGPGAGFSAPNLDSSSPVSENWTGYGTTPTPTQLQNFTGGWSATASVGLGQLCLPRARLEIPREESDSDFLPRVVRWDIVFRYINLLSVGRA